MRASVCAFGRLVTATPSRGPVPGQIATSAARDLVPPASPLLAPGDCRLAPAPPLDDDERTIAVAFGKTARGITRRAAAEGELADLVAIAKAAHRHPGLVDADLLRLVEGRPRRYVAQMLAALGMVGPMSSQEIRPWLRRYQHDSAVAEALGPLFLWVVLEQGLPIDPDVVDQAISEARRLQQLYPEHWPTLPLAAIECVRQAWMRQIGLEDDERVPADIAEQVSDPAALLLAIRRYRAVPEDMQPAFRGLLGLSRVNLGDPALIRRARHLDVIVATSPRFFAAFGVADLHRLLDPGLTAAEAALVEAVLVALPLIPEARREQIGEVAVAIARGLAAKGHQAPKVEETRQADWLQVVRAQVADVTAAGSAS